MKTLITITIVLYALLLALVFTGCCMNRFAPFAYSYGDNTSCKKEMHK